MLTKYGKTITYINNKNGDISTEEQNTFYAFKIKSADGNHATKIAYAIRGIKKEDLVDYQDLFSFDQRIFAFNDVINSLDLRFSSSTTSDADIKESTIYYWGVIGTDTLVEIYKKVLNGTQEIISYSNPSIISITKTVFNNTVNDIIINSVYLCSYPTGKYTGVSGSETVQFLIDYEDLDSQITLHPGDKLTFTLLIR